MEKPFVYKKIPKKQMKQQKLGLEFAKEGLFNVIAGNTFRFWHPFSPNEPHIVRARIIADRRASAGA